MYSVFTVSYGMVQSMGFTHTMKPKPLHYSLLCPNWIVTCQEVIFIN